MHEATVNPVISYLGCSLYQCTRTDMCTAPCLWLRCHISHACIGTLFISTRIKKSQSVFLIQTRLVLRISVTPYRCCTSVRINSRHNPRKLFPWSLATKTLGEIHWVLGNIVIKSEIMKMRGNLPYMCTYHCPPYHQSRPHYYCRDSQLIPDTL